MRAKVTFSGISLPTLLTLVFLVLKLTHEINWSWIWVFAPLWISLGLGIVILIICLIFLILSGMFDKD